LDSVIGRLYQHFRREGFAATAREVGRRLRKLAYLREEHLWYELDLDDGRLRRELPQGLRLVRAGEPEVTSVAALGQDVEQTRERLEQGNDLWLVFEGERPLFACYTFRQVTPVMAASHGELALPTGAACVEDAVTAPAARGRGIAPGAWTLIGDQLEQDGYRALVLKIETANASSRKAVEKIGFRPVAVMQHERMALRRRTAVETIGNGLGEELAARLI
jgi:RimJ/RimL family protein N-acetyltransferase